VSGQKGGCAIHICRTPAASAATIVFVVAVAFDPSRTSPTRSRVVGSRFGETCKPESFVTFSLPVLFVYPFQNSCTNDICVIYDIKLEMNLIICRIANVEKFIGYL
jgi:hypothetical protein